MSTSWQLDLSGEQREGRAGATVTLGNRASKRWSIAPKRSRFGADLVQREQRSSSGGRVFV